MFQVAYPKYRMRLSPISAHGERRKDVIQVFSEFCYSFYTLCNTVKRTLWGLLSSRITLWLITSWVCHGECFPWPSRIWRATHIPREANRNLVPRRKRLWVFRHVSRFLEPFWHLEKEPVTCMVKFQRQPEQAFECCDSFWAPKAYFIPDCIVLG